MTIVLRTARFVSEGVVPGHVRVRSRTSTAEGLFFPMRALLAGACLTLLAGCAAPATGQGAAPDVQAAPSGGVLPVEAVQPAADGDEGARGASCTGPAGVRVSYPADWSVNPGDTVPACTMFAPEPFAVPPHTDARVASVVLSVSDLPFEEAAAPTPDETTRTDEVVDGHPAVRTELVAGPGLWPEGTPSTRWVVDLGERTLVADAVGLPPFDHERDVAVLDAMMRDLAVRTAV
jgi:hypothetical protein